MPHLSLLSGRARGVALTGTGVLVLSPDSILIRLLGSDLPTTLFWRGLAMSLGMFAYLLIRYQGRPASILRQLRTPRGCGLGLLFALTNILFVTAVSTAAIADTLGCLATASIFAAIFSTFFLGERAPLRTWVTSGVIAAGLFMIAVGGGGSMLGRLLGIAAAAGMGGCFVLMRADGESETVVPGLALSGSLVALMTAIPAEIFSLDATGALALAGLLVILPIAFALIGRGPRYLPAPDVSLLMLLETVFGTAWAWLMLSEAPTRTTLAAIVVILTALTLYFARQHQVERRARNAA